MPRLKSLWVVVCFSGVAALGLLWYLMPLRDSPAEWATVPPESLALTEQLGHPSFADIKIYEQNLPQIQPLSRFEQRPRYVYFPSASWGTGWNNVFQEQLLNTHLAYLSERAYVFPQYIPRDHPPFPDTLPNGTRHMLNIPMNAFVSGPTGGGPLSADGSDDLRMRAVPDQGWGMLCPPSQTVVLNVHETMRELGIDDSSEGEEMMTRWAKKLREMSAPCVSIEGGSVFNYMFTGSPRVLSIWPSYGIAPPLKYFAWSPLITAALYRNFHLFGAGEPPEYLTPTSPAPYKFTSFRPLHASGPPVRGTLGIHIRRGDYEGHCVFLADYSAAYNAWSALGTPGLGTYPSRPDFVSATPKNYVWPALADHFTVPEGKTQRDAALDHCWPTPEAIVARARRVRQEAPVGQNLRRMYISTNGDRTWVGDLTAMLLADGWEEVKSSWDMELTLEEQAVGHAVDMGVLTAAEAFIGVGFSSLSSNVVQIRLAGGRHPGSIHFW
ncbi:SH3 and PX-domain-containing 3 [Mycena sanguinolenta]|uniref:SH3 and PX-domain-containing 3 n=1 Tax=Mycena sanguinolenta TaxID=230812 RepID=A0A8H6Y9V9_9AGAR|nr:SH3 and PX-domain-containing 3 [Mycena sanguinolenta]